MATAPGPSASCAASCDTLGRHSCTSRRRIMSLHHNPQTNEPRNAPLAMKRTPRAAHADFGLEGHCCCQGLAPPCHDACCHDACCHDEDAPHEHALVHAFMYEQRQQPRQKRHKPTGLYARLLLLHVLLLCTWSVTAALSQSDQNADKRSSSRRIGTSDDTLTPDSVVLLTGAAGFLGSELAMALGRVYDVRKIICIDTMSTTSRTATSTSSTTSGTSTPPPPPQDDTLNLALFEFQRQRAFHVLQELQHKIHFYRSDMSPSLPEYFDLGQVPLLDYIWKEHDDITHVVHFAESSTQQPYMAVPRTKDSIRAGLLESVLEQVLKQERRPHLVYASSYEVYNHRRPTPITTPQSPPFREDLPISVPSSLRGASKALDEMLAYAYYESDQVFSVGLRFFSIYGPWGVPGSPLFEMAERAVAGDVPILLFNNNSSTTAFGGESDLWDDVRDYLYIDDAVDAVLSAMQVRTVDEVPLVVNVGSGVGTSLRNVAKQMETLLPRTTPTATTDQENEKGSTGDDVGTASYASMERAVQVLGFRPQVSLEQGLAKLLAWHYDRAFPYGIGSSTSGTDTAGDHYAAIAKQGIVACLPFDKECLKGTPVFPCASECSHETQCTTSFYDDVSLVTRSLTTACRDVLYTVALDSNLERIPSANMEGSSSKASHLEDGPCNIAFVSESSPLVQRLKVEQGFTSASTVVEEFLRIAEHSNGKDKKLLTHGFWTLIPVWTPSFPTGDEALLRMLPKLSPGLFFGKATEHAVYCEPNVIFRSVKALIREAHMQPYLEGVEGATAMLVARERPGPTTPFGNAAGRIGGLPLPTESVQQAAYRMIQIGAIDEMIPGDNGSQNALVDSSWVVHTLQNEDSRLFRCDVLGEVFQWDVPTDKTAFEFIMELHDMWSRVIVDSKGNEPWWIGDGVVTVRQETTTGEETASGDADDGGAKSVEGQRRLAEEEINGQPDDSGEEENNEDASEEEVESKDASEDDENETEDTSEESEEKSEGEKELLDAEVAPEERKEGSGDDADEKAGSGDETDVEEHAGEKDEAFDAKIQDGAAAVEGGNEGFLGEKSEQVDTGAVEVKQNDESTEDEGESGDTPQEDENEIETGDEDKSEPERAVAEDETEDLDRDASAYDTWMGVLSSTSTYYFVRIVPSSEVGAMFLDDYSVEQT